MSTATAASIAPDTTSHPVNTDLDLVSQINRKTQTAEVHKAGCAHRNGGEDTPRPFTGTYADDYFHVAPCARKRTPR